MCSRWKVGLVVKIRIIGVIKNKKPALLGTCENSKSIAKAVDRLPKQLCNGDEVVLGSRRLADVDPEYRPEPIIVG
jgi:hypothetical protein